MEQGVQYLNSADLVDGQNVPTDQVVDLKEVELFDSYSKAVVAASESVSPSVVKIEVEQRPQKRRGRHDEFLLD